MYRPEFAYPTPEGSRDEPFEYYFDSNNSASLGTTFTSGTRVLNIPLRLQSDADFYWRGIKIWFTSNASQSFVIRFRDGYGNYLSEFIPVYCAIASPTPQQAPAGGNPVVLEPEIFCPKGTVLFMDIIAL